MELVLQRPPCLPAPAAPGARWCAGRPGPCWHPRSTGGASRTSPLALPSGGFRGGPPLTDAVALQASG
eukprot:365101-Alexandrium_andersonii.AAC.1